MKKKVMGVFLVFGISLMANDVVVDDETGLIWQDSASIVKKDWSGAKSYCKDLSLGGYSNWRLPHIDELISIVDTSRKSPAIKKIFKNTKSDYYWSSTEYKGDSSKAWDLIFYNGGDLYNDKSNDYYVRCVVGRQ
jgi:hypothetical protein